MASGPPRLLGYFLGLALSASPRSVPEMPHTSRRRSPWLGEVVLLGLDLTTGAETLPLSGKFWPQGAVICWETRIPCQQVCWGPLTVRIISHLRERSKNPWERQLLQTRHPPHPSEELSSQDSLGLSHRQFRDGGVGGGTSEEDSDFGLEQPSSDTTVWPVVGEGWAAVPGCWE